MATARRFHPSSATSQSAQGVPQVQSLSSNWKIARASNWNIAHASIGRCPCKAPPQGRPRKAAPEKRPAQSGQRKGPCFLGFPWILLYGMFQMSPAKARDHQHYFTVWHMNVPHPFVPQSGYNVVLYRRACSNTTLEVLSLEAQRQPSLKVRAIASTTLCTRLPRRTSLG